MDKTNFIVIFVLTLVLTQFMIVSAQSIRIETVILSTEFPNVLRDSVSAEYPRLYKIDSNIKGFNQETTRVEVIAEIDGKVQVQFPVSVTIIQRDETNLITLPRSFPAANGTKVSYYSASKTLCIPEFNDDPNYAPERFIKVVVSSGSIESVNFKISILIKDDAIQIQRHKPITVNLTPLSSSFINVPFEHDSSTNVLIRMNSNNDQCMGAIVQHLQCSYAEDEGDLGLPHKSWNIFSKNAIIRVDMRDYLKGFRLKAVVFKDDSLCGGLRSSSRSHESRKKKITITVEDDLGISIENLYFWVVILSPVIFSICVAMIFGCSYLVCYRRHLKYDKRFYNLRTEYEKRMNLTKLAAVKNKQNKSDYGKWTFIVSMFFAIILIQQAIYEKTTYDEHGLPGACVYDSLCSHPLWIFKDFNHIWSNASYLLLGIFFMLFTSIKKWIWDKYKTVGTSRNGVTYLPGHYYAMGISMILFGVINASYHACPSTSKFQYELIYLSFVTIICCLKIVELRRQKSFKTVSVFGILLVCFVISEVGIAFERYFPGWDDLHLGFRIFIAVLQGIFCFYMSIYWIYYGYPIKKMAKDEVPVQKPDPQTASRSSVPHRSEAQSREESTPLASANNDVRDANILRSIGDIPRCCFFLPKVWKWSGRPFEDPERFVFVVLLLGLNGYLIYLSLTMTYCLYVFFAILSNFGLLLFFYLTMKLIIGEFLCGWLNLTCIILLVFGLVFGTGSGYFFLETMGEWTQPATYTRIGSEGCIPYLPYQFYSKHDAWHFLSAHTLFFFFMVLLTIDDGVENTDMECIMSF